MSRSIHIPAWRIRFGEPDYWAVRKLDKLELRAFAAEDRARPDDAPPHQAAEGIPIRILDAAKWVRYPAGPSDVRALLSELPWGLTDGVASVDLCFRSAVYRANAVERAPGVYCPRLLGCYREGRISLSGYVYDPRRRDCDVLLLELWIRFLMLATLMHEIAHHFDRTRRTARGRWSMANRAKAEKYADAIAPTLTEQFVEPYLARAYAREAAELSSLGRWPLHVDQPPLPLSRNKSLAHRPAEANLSLNGRTAVSSRRAPR